ncbi:hypothetical protein [uncultured Deinococcus sp.]|uniref:hypothetical protein n=1 Tax=uncultured Deinococcus sp. TaxID=158789 RepID=UPI0025836B02|nr:hypothetical protein [uncultured Deinococcus sp.]
MKKLFLLLTLGLTSGANAQEGPWYTNQSLNLAGIQLIWDSNGTDFYGEEITAYAMSAFKKANIPVILFPDGGSVDDLFKIYQGPKPIGVASMRSLYQSDYNQTTYFYTGVLTVERTAPGIPSVFYIYNAVSYDKAPYKIGKNEMINNARRMVDKLIEVYIRGNS